jgi:hypothetical protein
MTPLSQTLNRHLKESNAVNACALMNPIRTFYNHFIIRLVSYLTTRNPGLATRLIYRHVMGCKLNLQNPTTYNEKVLWLKLYNENPLMIQCGDKYGVRRYVEEKGCAELLNELYGVYDSADEIDFSVVPQKFVLKITNACGYNIICDKADLDEQQVRRQLKKWQKTPFGLTTAEPHYLKMRSRIICERFLVDTHAGTLNDYRVHCLNGVPVYIAATNLQRTGPYRVLRFDFERNVINIPGEDCPDADMLTMMPDDAVLAKIQHYAQVLSKGIRLVRIDFYIIDGRIVLGEMTFTPGAGLLPAADRVFEMPRYRHHLQGIC